LDSKPELGHLHNTPITLSSYLREKFSYEFLTDCLIEYDVMLELASLELFHALEFHFGNIISVHVHEYILNHDDA
jgi:hypothetical protein